MTTATPSTALVPIQPAFTNAGRLALAEFLAGWQHGALLPWAGVLVAPARRWGLAEVCATGQSRYLLSVTGAWPHALTPTAP